MGRWGSDGSTTTAPIVDLYFQVLWGLTFLVQGMGGVGAHRVARRYREAQGSKNSLPISLSLCRPDSLPWCLSPSCACRLRPRCGPGIGGGGKLAMPPSRRPMPGARGQPKGMPTRPQRPHSVAASYESIPRDGLSPALRVAGDPPRDTVKPSDPETFEGFTHDENPQARRPEGPMRAVSDEMTEPRRQPGPNSSADPRPHRGRGPAQQAGHRDRPIPPPTARPARSTSGLFLAPASSGR